MSARSYLYVPGDQPDKLAKAASRGADALILDLEDAVPLANKDIARETVAEYLRSDEQRPPCWVRVNSGELLAADIASLPLERIAGLSLAKADMVGLTALQGYTAGDLPVIALVETAEAVLQIAEIAHAPGVCRMAIGEADLAAELGMTPSEDGREFAPIRNQVVVASAAAGLDGPIGPVSTQFRDLEELGRSTYDLFRAGFLARAAIHPAQIKAINQTLTPSGEEVASAMRLIKLFESNSGAACVDESGRMVDEAVVRSARRLLSRAELD